MPELSPTAAYSERLRTPWWWYLAALAVAVLLGLEFASAVSGWIAWVPFAVMLPVCLLVVWRLSSGRVTVTDSTVTAGDRSLDLAEVAQVIPLTGTELRRLVGRHSDPLAYTFIRSWVGPGVQFVLTDVPEQELPDVEPLGPDEDEDDFDAPLPPLRTPYWLISTRHPERVMAALSAR